MAAVLKGRTVYVDRRGVGYVSARIGITAGHRTGGMELQTGLGGEGAEGIIVEDFPVRRVVRDPSHDTGNHSG